MSRLIPPRLIPPRRMLEIAPLRAIALTRGVAERDGRARWAAGLTWFCRLCAVFWLLAGLLNWGFVLGVIVPPGLAFDTADSATQWTSGFFAVIDLIAAVGLWLTAPWGGTVWLLAAAAQIAFPFMLHDYGTYKSVTIGVNVVLIFVYLLLNYMSRREERRL